MREKERFLKLDKCDECRFDQNQAHPDIAGGDCGSCKDHDQFMEKKRIVVAKCKKCLYRNDPCHYLCVACQDASNYTPKNKRKIQRRLLGGR